MDWTKQALIARVGEALDRLRMLQETSDADVARTRHVLVDVIGILDPIRVMPVRLSGEALHAHRLALARVARQRRADRDARQLWPHLEGPFGIAEVGTMLRRIGRRWTEAESAIERGVALGYLRQEPPKTIGTRRLIRQWAVAPPKPTNAEELVEGYTRPAPLSSGVDDERGSS